MIELEYCAPPDLMNRFVATPYGVRAISEGVEICVRTNFDGLRIEGEISPCERIAQIDWTVVVEEHPAQSRMAQMFSSEEVTAIVSASGAMTLFDCESGEAFTFGSSKAEASRLVAELLPTVVAEYRRFHKE